MARQLPPLNALKAFEAAARLQSFTLAAAELNVTHAAISRHIRGLEALLRLSLFDRTGRGITLTDQGAELLRQVSPAFDMLAAATSRFFAKPKRRSDKLTITTDTPLAMLWLVPRLGRFTALHPGIDIVIDPTPRLVDFAKEEFDLGIRYGAGRWRDVAAEKIIDAECFPVCSPALFAKVGCSKPADLPAHLMMQEQDRALWTNWLDAAGVSRTKIPEGPTLFADLTLMAAEAGQGFALSDQVLSADAIAGGRLIRPFDVSFRLNGYYLVRRHGAKPSRAAESFRSWLMIEMARTTAELARLKSRAAAKPDTRRLKHPNLKR